MLNVEKMELDDCPPLLNLDERLVNAIASHFVKRKELVKNKNKIVFCLRIGSLPLQRNFTRPDENRVKKATREALLSLGYNLGEFVLAETNDRYKVTAIKE